MRWIELMAVRGMGIGDGREPRGTRVFVRPEAVVAVEDGSTSSTPVARVVFADGFGYYVAGTPEEAARKLGDGPALAEVESTLKVVEKGGSW